MIWGRVITRTGGEIEMDGPQRSGLQPHCVMLPVLRGGAVVSLDSGSTNDRGQ